MNSTTRKILCILCAIAAAACVILACFTLSKKKQTTEKAASSAAAAVSRFGSVADFDYENFNYSDDLDENGRWTAIQNTADYITLPADYNAISISEIGRASCRERV